MIHKITEQFPRGLYAVGACEMNDFPVCCLTEQAIKISDEPQAIAIVLPYSSYVASCIQTNREFTLSLIAEGASDKVIERLRNHSGRGENTFDGIGYITVMNKLPVLRENICGWVHCKTVNIVDCGTHVIFVGEICEGEDFDGTKPMIMS